MKHTKGDLARKSRKELCCLFNAVSRTLNRAEREKREALSLLAVINRLMLRW